MKSFHVLSVFGAALLLVSSISAGEAPTEVPFVEGQPPPAAKPGEGWCLVTKPPCYKTVSEQVQVRPASFYLETIPAKFETKAEQVQVGPDYKTGCAVPCKTTCQTKQILCREEQVCYEIIPAKYECVTENIEVAPAYETQEVVPAVFRCEDERIQVAPATVRVVKRDGCPQTKCGPCGPEVVGECYCTEEVPAQYVCIKKQVLVSDACVRTVKVPAQTRCVKVMKKIKDAEVVKKVTPAEYQTVEVHVVTPGKVDFQAVPAKFETVQKQVECVPSGTVKIEVPAKFETVTKQVLDTPGQVVWRKIACHGVVKKYKEVPGTDIESLMILKNK